MKGRVLARLGVAVGAVLVAAASAAAPAFAQENEEVVNEAVLHLAAPTAAKDFTTKGCDGIPGGAKTGTDGWVFDQPAKDAKNYGYIFGLADPQAGQPYVLLVSEDGVAALKFPDAAAAKAATKPGADLKKLEDAIEATDADGKLGDEAGEPEVVPAPAGVAGALTAGGGWLQTPAGWVLASGALLHDGADTTKQFDLVRVCLPATGATPTTAAPTTTTPAAAAPGQGGGQTLPLTGVNVALISGIGVVLLVGGIVLLSVRRRRRPVKFTA